MAMVNNGMGQAEIRLDPPELGHMMVRIQVQNDQTQVQFQVANPAARELLEQATPRLRDMLAEQGMNLADSEVSYHNGGNNERGNQGDDGEAGSSRNAYADSAIEAEEVSLINIAADQSSGIDYYA
nr:flagellar hook-length control protein FliK [Parashewanella hymeniacidonis]